MNILILNGPNLNLLGKRQTEIYGTQTMEEVFEGIVKAFPDHTLTYFQSNHEGAILDKLHDVGYIIDGIVLNAGALTHTSIAIADAVSAITTPVIEVHISNIYEREQFRHHSYLTEVCAHHIIGEGVNGYRKAVEFLIK